MRENIRKLPNETKDRHILLVVRWPVGGIRTFLKYLISEFPSECYRFWFVGVSTEGLDSLSSDLDHLVDNWTLVPPDGNEVLNISKAIWSITRRHHFDAIHAHGFTSAIACLPIRLITRSALVCTAHDTLSDVQFLGLRGTFQKVVLGVALWRCKFIHSVSKDAESNLLSYYPFLKRKSVVIESGIDVNPFKECKPMALHQKLGIERSVKLLGFFGRFMGPKGFKYLVGAIELLRDERGLPDIHVVCFGSGAFIREEQDVIEKKGLASYFTFLPFIHDVSGAMKGCDLIVMPSLREACGLVAMESLVAGVPIVGTNCIGLREVLEGTPAVMVSAGDSVFLAQGIIQGLEMGRKPFEGFAAAAAERFDIHKTALGVYQLYEQVSG